MISVQNHEKKNSFSDDFFTSHYYESVYSVKNTPKQMLFLLVLLSITTLKLWNFAMTSTILNLTGWRQEALQMCLHLVAARYK